MVLLLLVGCGGFDTACNRASSNLMCIKAGRSATGNMQLSLPGDLFGNEALGLSTYAGRVLRLARDPLPALRGAHASFEAPRRGLRDRRTPLGRNQEKRRGADIVLARKGALAGAERVGFCAGGKAQSRQRQSRGKPADGVDKPPAVARASICRNHPAAHPRRRPSPRQRERITNAALYRAGAKPVERAE